MTVSIERSKFGREGIDGYVITVDIIPEDVRTEDSRLKDTSLRSFKVMGSLTKSSPLPDQIKASVKAGDGNSFFSVPELVKMTKIQGNPYGNYIIYINSNNEFATVALDLQANSWMNALDIFTKGISPYLDRLAYIADVPVSFETIYCHDLNNHIHVASYKTPYSNVQINPMNYYFPNLFPHLRSI